jgi:hypothetical protein
MNTVDRAANCGRLLRTQSINERSRTGRVDAEPLMNRTRTIDEQRDGSIVPHHNLSYLGNRRGSDARIPIGACRIVLWSYAILFLMKISTVQMVKPGTGQVCWSLLKFRRNRTVHLTCPARSGLSRYYGTKVCRFTRYAAASSRSIQPSWLVSASAKVPPRAARTLGFARASASVTFPSCLASSRLY